MAVAESMLAITSSNEMEAFWLAKGLAGIINKHSEIVFSELIQSYHRYLSSGQNTNKLYRYKNYQCRFGIRTEFIYLLTEDY